MAENKTIKTTLDFDVLNADKLDSIFSSIRENLSSEKLKSEVDRINHMTGTMFAKMRHELESSGKITLKGSGIDRVTRQYASLVDKVFKELSGVSLDEEFKQIDNSLAQRHASISKAYVKIQEIEKQMDQKRAKLAERGDDTDIFGIKAGHLDTADKISAKLEELTKKKKELEDSKKSTTGIEKQIEGLDKYAEEFKKLQVELGRMRQQIGGHRGSAGRSQIAIEQLEASKIEIQKKIAEGAGEGQEGYKEFVALLEMIQNEYRAIARAQQEAFDQKGAEEIKKEEEALKKLNKQQKESKKSWGAKILQGFSYYAIFNRIKKLWTTSIRTLQELDRAMVQAAIVTNMTQKETWKLLGSYQELAKEVGRSTSEIAGLSAFFLQQGMSVKSAAEMTEVAAKSAAIAGISLQEAANYLTSAVNGFGLAASAAEDVADKFAAVGAASAANFEELAIAMSKVAPVAQSAGVGLDFMLGVLAKGIHTTREAPENIGTAFKTIFARMRELTDIGKATEDGMSLNRVEKALQSVGVALRDEIGQFRNLEDVLYDVGHQWKNLDSLQQAYLATALAGSRQQPRLMAILNDFETTVEFIEISKDSAKAMEYQHMEYMDGMEAASQAVKNAWEGVITTIVSSDAIISILKGISNLLENLTKALGFFEKGVGRAVGVVILLVSATAALTIGLKAAGAASVKFARMIGLIGPASTKAAVGVKILGVTVSKSTLILTAVAVVIVGLLAAYSALTKSAEKSSKAVERSNKMIYESAAREKDLNKLIEEYEMLSQKIHKTNEELERMKELQSELSTYDGIGGEQVDLTSVDADGEIVINQRKVSELRAKERVERAIHENTIAQQMKKSNEEIRKAQERELNYARAIADVGKDGYNQHGYYIDDYTFKIWEEEMKKARELQTKLTEEHFDTFRQNFTEAGVAAGISYFEGLGDMDPKELSKLEAAMTRTLSSMSAGSFLNADGMLDIEKAMEQGKALAKALQKGVATEEEKRKAQEGGIVGTLGLQVEKYNQMVDAIKEMGLDERDTRELIYQLGFEYKDEQTASVLVDRGVNIDIIGNFIDKGGKLAELQKLAESMGLMDNKGQGVSEEEIQRQRDRQKEIDARRSELTKELEDAEKAYTGRANMSGWGKFTSGNWSKLSTFREQFEADSLRIQKELDAMTEEEKSFLTEEQIALSKIDSSTAEKLISRSDIESGIKEMHKSLVDGGMEVDKAADYIQREVLSNLNIKNAMQIADSSANMGDYMKKALGLEESIAKGDFNDYLDLIGEFGADVVDKFMETGDPSALIAKSTTDMMKDIEDEMSRLKGSMAIVEKGSEDWLSYKNQISALEVMKGSIQTINYEIGVYEARLKKATDYYAAANEQLAMTEKMIDAGFGEDNPMVGFLLDMSEYSREVAKQISSAELDSIFKDIEKSRDELIKKGYMDKDGKLIVTTDSKPYHEAYKLLLDKGQDAIKLVAEEGLREIEANNEEFAKKIKESNEYYKELISGIKDLHSERWKDIDYENKLIDLEKNIVDARNKLAAAKVDGTRGQILSAQEELRRIQQDRRKEIEEQMMTKLEKSLEEQRKKEEDRLEKEKLKANEDVVKATNDNTTAVKSLTEKLGEDKYVKPSVETKPSGGGSGAPRDGGSGIINRLESLM